MTDLWLGLFAVTSLALLFVWWPYFRQLYSNSKQERLTGESTFSPQGAALQGASGQNTFNHGTFSQDTFNSYQQRLAELQQERDQQQLDQATFTALKAELDATFLLDVEQLSSNSTSPVDLNSTSGPASVNNQDGLAVASQAQHQRQNSNSWWLPGAMSVVLIGGSLWLYGILGAGQQWGSITPEVSEKTATPTNTPPSLSQDSNAENTGAIDSLSALKEQLKAQPDNPEGWFLLGRTLLQLQQYQDAYEAFTIVADLVGEHPAVLSQQAQARYFGNEHQMDGQALQLLLRAQMLNPNDPTLLAFSGVLAFDQGNYAQAINNWQLALASHRPEINPERLANAIEQAQQALAKERNSVDLKDRKEESHPSEETEQGSQSKPALTKSTMPGTPLLLVGLAISPALETQVSPGQTVFLLARSVESGSPPLAAVRLQVADLPRLVSVDDHSAMLPDARLSMATEVYLEAVVSQKGVASISPGDLIGRTDPFKPSQLGATRISLVIDQKVQ